MTTALPKSHQLMKVLLFAGIMTTLKTARLKVSALYHSKEVSLPVGVHWVMKPDYQTDPKTGKRKALFTKNHYCRSLVAKAVQNNLRFRYVLMDIGFASQTMTVNRSLSYERITT
ncbi:MAG: hypothetical protein SVR94_00945 [Pseudomonadota bacterium]|nr:hypothetical protein [Pseudomonadota bacterium]